MSQFVFRSMLVWLGEDEWMLVSVTVSDLDPMFASCCRSFLRGNRAMDGVDDVSDLDPMFASCHRSFLRGGRAMDAVDDVVSLPTDNTTAAGLCAGAGPSPVTSLQ